MKACNSHAPLAPRKRNLQQRKRKRNVERSARNGQRATALTLPLGNANARCKMAPDFHNVSVFLVKQGFALPVGLAWAGFALARRLAACACVWWRALSNHN